MDYSKTLQLPETEFPMRGNLPQAEPKMQAWWNEIDIYQQVRRHRAGKPTFILHDGPPFANGDIHIGHALNKILKDFIVRYKSMQGFDAPYVPGWDTHGLPIEQAVANRDKIDRKSMSVHEFREYCREYAENFIGKQKQQFRRLGVRGDWDNPYITYQPQYEAQQIRVFGEMVKRGCIYKGLKPVYWSPSSESALAEAEIEYMEKTSHSIFVAFPVKDGKGVLNHENTSIVIWTTTPWTLPANLGVSLHPEFEYVVLAHRADDEAALRHYVVARGLLESFRSELGWPEEVTPVVQSFKGAELDRAVCNHPFYDRDSLVMVGEHVTLEAGTGCVHTAPGHGEDDFVIGKVYGLDVLCPVDNQGKFTAEAPDYAGMYYEKANLPIIERLQTSGLLLKQVQFQHQYPHDWRTKKPIIFRATEQWFASIDAFRSEMLEQIKQIKWTPQWGEIRLHNMIADRGDWCISRQRSWGVPIPIVYCRNCGQPHVNQESIEHVAGLFETEGSAAWYLRPEQELLPAGTVCPACGHAAFRKETDIMDVWFDSGASHMCVLDARTELQWPADLYLEGSDQYRGWYNSSLITGVAVRGQSPYKGVLSHGFVLDGEGRKMSKSLGNTVDPLKTCDKLGADILRLWVASVDYQSDVRISEHILTQITEVYRKIRNTLRYLLSNFGGFDPRHDRVSFADLSELDRYAMIRLQRLTERVLNAYEAYEFHIVYQAVHHFCAVELSAFYLDILKDRLYADEKHGGSRRSAQTVLYEMLTHLTKLIAPMLPHTADEVWRYIPHVEEISVQLTDMPTADASLFDEQLEDRYARLIEIRDEVLKALEEARKSKLIGNSLSAAVHIYPNRESAELLKEFADLEKLFIVSAVTVHPPDHRSVTEVEVRLAEGLKCERCWNVTIDVGADAHHPTCCARCAKVVNLELMSD